MKILHVITSLHTGGAEKLMVDLLPRLRDMGHEVELSVFDGMETPFMEQLRNSGIRVIKLSEGGESVYSPKYLKSLRNILKSGNYDIVHTHLTAPQLFTAISSLGTHSRLFTTEHNTTNRRRGNPLLKIGDKFMYSRYEKIICISHDAWKNMESYFGHSDSHVLINNGIDVSHFKHPIKDVSENETFLLTMVAAFRPQKDYQTLFKALKSLPKTYRLRVVGDGEQHDLLHTLAADMGLSERIEFTGNRSDIPDLLGEADVVVMSSHFEGLSLSSVEGMASGRPFIASDVPGLHDVVEGAGLLFPEGDAKALADAIRKVCENPSIYKSVAEACQKRAHQYDISLMSNRYNGLYCES